MRPPVLMEWGAGLVVVQAVLTFLPNAGPLPVLLRNLIWVAFGLGFLYWAGQSGLQVGRVLGEALRPRA
ncbi:hypothetical protein [Phenylobacterium soli]|uniref:Uncharacterized protein n=1 Tax=Phenylobacterium soli TaxID=2170551 RepID=A0A328AMK0_9CAUL|nr:hypothetical protein [Phenylobacterium soli]RAK55206.1 hypothetical protein DJ017_12090 [Phenylobacterium soli]